MVYINVNQIKLKLHFSENATVRLQYTNPCFTATMYVCVYVWCMAQMKDYGFNKESVVIVAH